MRLVGSPISPFVRRVAVALRLYGFEYEHIKASVVDDREVISGFSGLVRVPALELDGGEVLIDSHQILAELDRMVGPSRQLGLGQGSDVRAYGQIIAFLTGSMEKFVASFYERNRRPADKIWAAWGDQCEAQAVGGLSAAEALAGADARSGHLFESRMTHADIAAVLAVEMGLHLAPNMVDGERFPKLFAIAERWGSTPEFASTRP